MSDFEKKTADLIDFISRSPSPWHAADNFAAMLLGCNFRRLEEGEEWRLESGGDYFVTRGESSLIAFRIPDAGDICDNFQIVAAHSDSPSFKIKENAEIISEHYTRLDIEKYGGMIVAPWLDRPLSVAGRAAVRNGRTIESQLVNFDRDLVLIPNLAIHMNREINNSLSYEVQSELCPLIGSEKCAGRFRSLIAEELEINADDILSTDLFLYSRTPGTIWGADREYFSSPKIDDLQCAWSAVTALMDGTNEKSICMAAIFDHEEVGSLSRQGADSTFLNDTLHRICTCLGMDDEHFRMMTARSFMISADNSHAVHPAHPEKADPVNRPYMNEGPVIKYSASLKYMTDAVSAAVFREICAKAGVPVQVFANHSDIPGGSTLGRLSNAHISLNTVDIGMAQLSMHSPCETAGVRDTEYLIEALTAFYRTHISVTSDGFRLD